MTDQDEEYMPAETTPTPAAAPGAKEEEQQQQVDDDNLPDDANDLAAKKHTTPKNTTTTTSSTPPLHYRNDAAEYDSLLERYSVRVATRPCLNFWLALMISLGIGMVGVTVGDFSVAVDNAGWFSRGTLIADRHQQYRLVDVYRDGLFADGNVGDGTLWDDLINKRQARVATDDDDDRRQLWTTDEDSMSSTRVDVFSREAWTTLGSRWQAGMQFLSGMRVEEESSDGTRSTTTSSFTKDRRSFQAKAAASQDWLVRRLQQQQLDNQESLGPLEGCQIEAYNSSSLFQDTRLWPVWKNRKQSDYSLLDVPALQEICEAEAVTQRFLEENGLCGGCNDEKKCLQPYSLVLFVRMTVTNGLTMSCSELVQAWSTSYQSSTEQDLVPCVETLKLEYNPDEQGAILPSACPAYFFPSMLDANYDDSKQQDISHSSSIFATLDTEDAIDELYESVEEFGYGTEYTYTYYDTQYEDFNVFATDEQLLIDMGLAVGSAG